MNRKPNAIPGGGAIPLDRAKDARKTNLLAPGGTGANSAWIGQRTPETEERYGVAGSAKDFGTSGNVSEQSGTSIFDPVLCEIAYRWFCPSGGSVLDTFAGGSVRGIVAAFLGLNYTGVDLSARQLDANRQQAETILKDRSKPTWICGDSAQLETLVTEQSFDLIFSCPPYGSLEVYSENPVDLSTMTHEDFMAAYSKIIAAAVAKLKPNRFAIFVVGDFRDEKGFYRNFVSDTISAFQDAGAKLYNEAILITAVGSLPIRITKQFESGRKMGKTHQNFLVFCKGDWKQAAKDINGSHSKEEVEAEEAAIEQSVEVEQEKPEQVQSVPESIVATVPTVVEAKPEGVTSEVEPVKPKKLTGELDERWKNYGQ